MVFCLHWRGRLRLGRGVDVAGIHAGKDKVDSEPERLRILSERDAGIEVSDHGSVGYLGLARAPAMWGFFVSLGCCVYSLYLYLTWLPN
jgi:hypothetical protein